MIKRDEHGIIVQHDPQNQSYGDGGDSSRATGIMALFDSKFDQQIIAKHYTQNEGFVRHPTQTKWNDPKDFSRDQLLCLVAGMKKSGLSSLVRREFFRQYWKGICPNGDLLGPEFFWHVIRCGRVYWLYFLWPIGIVSQIIHIIYMTKVAPRQEQNQTIAIAAISDLLWLWVFLHPNWKQSIRDYWSGWRNQNEIAEFLIEQIEQSMN
jgi:hypothetical protein